MPRPDLVRELWDFTWTRRRKRYVLRSANCRMRRVQPPAHEWLCACHRVSCHGGRRTKWSYSGRVARYHLTTCIAVGNCCAKESASLPGPGKPSWSHTPAGWEKNLIGLGFRGPSTARMWPHDATILEPPHRLGGCISSTRNLSLQSEQADP